MASLSDLSELVGFFSYSREDDAGSDGALSTLRDAIQRELSAQLGRSRADFRVWQDKAAISLGTLWEKEIKLGIAQSVFFVPIVTPRAVKSRHCAFEFSSFLAREAELGRDDLVFPILYIPVPELEDENLWRADPVLKIVGTRQYLDWRYLRHRDFGSTEVRIKVEDFCRNIANALRKNSAMRVDQSRYGQGEGKEQEEPSAVERRTAGAAAAAFVTAESHASDKVEPRHGTEPARKRDAVSRPELDGGGPAPFERHRAWQLPRPRLALFAASAIVLAALLGGGGFWLQSRSQTPASVSTALVPLSLDRERALRSQDSFKECAGCPEMVVVAAGSFTMGSASSEASRRDNEGPQHSVTFTKPFGVGRFAVTFDEWDMCVAAGGCHNYSPADNGWGRGRRPVINVDWEDAKSYVDWLAKLTGKAYRLLSEAEREYAARAGGASVYSFGDDTALLGQYGWYLANAAGQTHPVGEKAANAFGLFDIQGNSWDWTEDCLNANYNGAPTDGSAWVSGECTSRILRGGSWFQNAEALRAARRGWGSIGHRVNNFGFRVGRTLSVAADSANGGPPGH
jgi:formylglycine-generating enzyme required for sulfatase activity